MNKPNIIKPSVKYFSERNASRFTSLFQDSIFFRALPFIFSALILTVIWTAFGHPLPGDLRGDDAHKFFTVLIWGTVIFGLCAMSWGAIQHTRKRDWRIAVFFGCFYLGLGGVLAFVRTIVDGGGFALPDIFGIG